MLSHPDSQGGQVLPQGQRQEQVHEVRQVPTQSPEQGSETADQLSDSLPGREHGLWQRHLPSRVTQGPWLQTQDDNQSSLASPESQERLAAPDLSSTRVQSKGQDVF